MYFFMHAFSCVSLCVSAPPSSSSPAPASLQHGYELALKERDAALREHARSQEDYNLALKQAQALRTERDQALDKLNQLQDKTNR